MQARLTLPATRALYLQEPEQVGVEFINCAQRSICFLAIAKLSSCAFRLWLRLFLDTVGHKLKPLIERLHCIQIISASLASSRIDSLALRFSRCLKHP